MNQFYVSIIFLGITLILVSLVCIAYDRKKSDDYVKRLGEKKEELIDIISDAEQMVEEMNKFSDYIATQMELKNEELSANLKVIDDKLTNISLRVHENADLSKVQQDKVVNGSPVGLFVKAKGSGFEHNSDLVIDKMSYENCNNAYMQNQKPYNRIKDNIIPLNGRHKEVISLAENGLNVTEIARRLNIGKGEVQLILGVNRN